MEYQSLDLATIRERQQLAWASGDYAMFGASLLIMSELLCEAVDLRPGQTVLDVATGSGNTARAAARRFGKTTGIDYVPALLERGRERAAAERLEVAFREGDARSIPLPDASFDEVLSTVGVMFAPDRERAAGELLRVCRPGGRSAWRTGRPTASPGSWKPLRQLPALLSRPEAARPLGHGRPGAIRARWA